MALPNRLRLKDSIRTSGRLPARRARAHAPGIARFPRLARRPARPCSLARYRVNSFIKKWCLPRLPRRRLPRLARRPSATRHQGTPNRPTNAMRRPRSRDAASVEITLQWKDDLTLICIVVGGGYQTGLLQSRQGGDPAPSASLAGNRQAQEGPWLCTRMVASQRLPVGRCQRLCYSIQISRMCRRS